MPISPAASIYLIAMLGLITMKTCIKAQMQDPNQQPTATPTEAQITPPPTTIPPTSTLLPDEVIDFQPPDEVFENQPGVFQLVDLIVADMCTQYSCDVHATLIIGEQEVVIRYNSEDPRAERLLPLLKRAYNILLKHGVLDHELVYPMLENIIVPIGNVDTNNTSTVFFPFIDSVTRTSGCAMQTALIIDSSPVTDDFTDEEIIASLMHEIVHRIIKSTVGNTILTENETPCQNDIFPIEKAWTRAIELAFLISENPQYMDNSQSLTVQEFRDDVYRYFFGGHYEECFVFDEYGVPLNTSYGGAGYILEMASRKYPDQDILTATTNLLNDYLQTITEIQNHALEQYYQTGEITHIDGNSILFQMDTSLGLSRDTLGQSITYWLHNPPTDDSQPWRRMYQEILADIMGQITEIPPTTIDGAVQYNIDTRRAILIRVSQPFEPIVFTISDGTFPPIYALMENGTITEVGTDYTDGVIHYSAAIVNPNDLPSITIALYLQPSAGTTVHVALHNPQP